MQLKKSKRANLERKRLAFLSLGFVISLALVLMSFEYGFKESRNSHKPGLPPIEIVDIELPPIVRVKKKMLPPPPLKKISHVVKPVKNDEPLATSEPNFDELPKIKSPDLPDVDYFPIEKVIEKDEIFVSVEEMPVFPGGEVEMFKYISKNINYPQIDMDAGIEGMVYVSFVVNKQGDVEGVKVLKGVSDSMNKEAERVIKSMPKWKAGLQRGRPVKVQFTIPIRFRLK